jgi:protein-S-isoprenylcysteine O-methyltransferase Ste14
MDVPGVLLTATVWSYWIGVGAMIVRIRRHTRGSIGVVPRQRLERIMGLIWVPLVIAWAVLPWLALNRPQSPWALPEFARSAPAYAVLRWVAAVVALACLAATIKCWARMGRDWRMAVTDEKDHTLITDGMFRRIRHPIYAFSILLMLSTMVIVPTWPMLAVGVVHIGLMVLKARNEERHLLASHGPAYARYLESTGRFVPRFR